MPRCDVCGSAHARPFTVYFRSRKHVFDCFECAVRGLTATCESCGGTFIRGGACGCCGCR